MSDVPLLDIRDLTVEYQNARTREPFKAVDEASLTIDEGETVGLVGESGSGKTTLGRAILGLAPVRSGTIVFDRQNITHANFKNRRTTSAALQVIFQDPYGSLNPTRTIGQALAEPVLVHERLNRPTVAARVRQMLETVGLPTDAAARYPREFSGGQRQRIAIARALMTNPKLIICDEPTSALDLSIQAQILNLLTDLQYSLGLSYLFISHDLAVVRHVAQRLVVMYQGRIVEAGPTKDIYAHPSHPYTQALLAAIPSPHATLERAQRGTRPAGNQPIPNTNNGGACPFAARCPYAVELCITQRPPLRITQTARMTACHNPLATFSKHYPSQDTALTA